MQKLGNNLIAVFLFIGSFVATCEPQQYVGTTVDRNLPVDDPLTVQPYATSLLIPPIQYFPGSSTPLPSFVSHPFGYNGFNRRYFELTDDLNYNLRYNLNQLNRNLHRNLNRLRNYYPNNFYGSGYYGYDF